MINKLKVVTAGGTDPYRNLAVEEYLTNTVNRGECILYLWQNRKTVVIGRNQNARTECRTDLLEADGGFLARRLSGGGAVYHDLGNLNFTFVTKAADYSVPRQLGVVADACGALGVAAEQSGRNDLMAGGRKFSGNAFYRSGDNCYHHGTVMISVDPAAVERYLNVDRDKLVTHGVDSVRSRVLNLTEIVKGITCSAFAEALKEAFASEYGLMPETACTERLKMPGIDGLREKYASWDWRYGRDASAFISFSRRFDWGKVEFRIDTGKGKIDDISVFSDAMEPEVIFAVKRALKGSRLAPDAVRRAISGIEPKKTEGILDMRRAKRMLEDISGLLAHEIR